MLLLLSLIVLLLVQLFELLLFLLQLPSVVYDARNKERTKNTNQEILIQRNFNTSESFYLYHRT